VRVNQSDVIWEIDGSQPVAIRHGWWGLLPGPFAETGDQELCSTVMQFAGFSLWIDGREVAPALYRVTVEPGSPCDGVFAYGPIFEIPAGTLEAGIHVFTGRWWRNGSASTGFLIDYFCPELVGESEAQAWLGTYERVNSATVVVSYP
jgi:hypothetical protein